MAGERQGSEMMGPRIRQRRHELEISLAELADQVGVTASFLSQVERDLASPSLQTLKTIAAALQVPLFFFLLDEESESYVVRHGSRKKLSLPDPKLDYELLTPGVNRHMLLFIGHYEPGTSSLVSPRQPSPEKNSAVEECIYVLQGSLEIELVQGIHILDAGDSIYFQARDLRRLAAHGDQELSYVSVSTPPAF
jgi:transcriptional regulator with XRE-family HTH domain